tara:strand:+ start:64 stop:741 length:678 start_codon:yes stop_codon:yes gene_type:complete
MPNSSYVASKTFLPTTSTTNIAIAADNASITAGNTVSFLTNTYFPESLNNPTNLGMRISISSGQNIANAVFTIVGTTPGGAALTTTVTGVNNNTVSTTDNAAGIFLSVVSITVSVATATNVNVGTLISATLSNTGVIFAGRTKVRGMQAYASGTTGTIDFHNTSLTGTIVSKFYVSDGPTGGYDIEPYIPDNGLLFKAGAYLNIQSTRVVEAITIYYDGPNPTGS